MCNDHRVSIDNGNLNQLTEAVLGNVVNFVEMWKFKAKDKRRKTWDEQDCNNYKSGKVYSKAISEY